MFTGIIEATSTLSTREDREVGQRLQFDFPNEIANELTIGESVAMNGCCLTVTTISDSIVTFDVLNETLSLTNLNELPLQASANIERSLKVGDRLSGHFVQGHIDEKIDVLQYEKNKSDHLLKLPLTDLGKQFLRKKCSISLNGTSLTVAEIFQDSFEVWIIPHTHDVTNLKEISVGSLVNVEYDMLAKHISPLAVS